MQDASSYKTNHFPRSIKLTVFIFLAEDCAARLFTADARWAGARAIAWTRHGCVDQCRNEFVWNFSSVPDKKKTHTYNLARRVSHVNFREEDLRGRLTNPAPLNAWNPSVKARDTNIEWLSYLRLSLHVACFLCLWCRRCRRKSGRREPLVRARFKIFDSRPTPPKVLQLFNLMQTNAPLTLVREPRFAPRWLL